MLVRVSREELVHCSPCGTRPGNGARALESFLVKLIFIYRNAKAGAHQERTDIPDPFGRRENCKRPHPVPK